MDKIVEKYVDPITPASFMDIGLFYDQLDSETKKLYTKAEVRKALLKEEHIAVMKDSPRKSESVRVIAPRRFYLFDTDVGMFRRDIISDNDGYVAFLVVIDAFSKFLWCKALKKITSKTVADAFENVLKESEKVCTNCRSDLGPEYQGHEFQSLMKKYKINHFFATGPRKACLAERVVQTVKQKISKYLMYHNTWTWYKILDDITYSYNNTVHSGINMIPAKVTEAEEMKVWHELYEKNFAYYYKVPNPKQKIEDQEDKKLIKKPIHRYNDSANYKFKLGDRVRVNVLRYKFIRKYSQQWSNEIFTVVDRFSREEKNMYKIKDFNNELISGSFFQNELMKAIVDRNTVYRISRIHKRTKDKYLVSWQGWSRKFDSWIDKDEIQDISEDKNKK